MTPEQWLARAARDEERRGRGALKVFFGAAPGVGKTCAMLEAGHRARQAGVDVVLGWVETHGRAETEALATGFERIAPRPAVPLPEFDLEAALARHPALILVDELPHTNAAGSVHTRRWRDVEDLLAAGIDVYTTLNVQHLESLVDVVHRITGVQVRETVPDAVIDGAAVELVDLPPDELVERIAADRVYPGRGADALAGFFRLGNLVALRELALRRVAERADADVLTFRRDAGIEDPWPAGERLLVAVGPAPQAADLVRAGARIAGRLHAPWVAATVDGGGWSDADRARVDGHLRLAEQLGAEVVTLREPVAVDALVGLARARNVTRIVVGRPTHPGWRDRVYGSFVDALVREAAGIDVIVTAGDGGPRPAPTRPPLVPPTAGELAEAFAWISAAAALGATLRGTLDLADQAMLHLLAVVLAASRVGWSASVFAVALAVASLDFLFVPPLYTFAVADGRHWLTFAVMGAVGLGVTHLTQRVRRAAEAAFVRERRTAALHALSRSLAGLARPDEIASAAVHHLRDLLDGEVVLVRAVDGGIVPLTPGELAPAARAVAVWVVGHGRPAGSGTDTLPATDHTFVPLLAAGRVIGALGLAAGDPLTAAERRERIEVAAATVGSALDRAWLAEASEAARVVLETERARTSLLSAVSHDLRTPLASITGAASAALADDHLPPDERRGLLSTIHDEGQRLGKLIGGLQDLTRLEADPRAVKEWVPLDEVVASAVDRLGRPVGTELPDEVLLVPMDPVLVDQLLYNLLENATKHAPGSPITVSARVEGQTCVVEVADRGPGLPPGAGDRVFERFWRAPDGARTDGAGLGLAIAAAIARAHGGRVYARDRAGGGAVFGFGLPLDG